MIGEGVQTIAWPSGLALVAAAIALTLWKVRRVHLMMFEIRADLDQGLRTLLMNEYKQLDSLLSLYVDLRPVASLGPTRDWAGSPDFLLLVAREVLNRKPGMVIECGSGTSTIVIARCLQIVGAGRLVSLDHEAMYAEQTRRSLERHGLSNWAEVLHAPLTEVVVGDRLQTWYETRDLPSGPIDLVVVDGPPSTVCPLARFPAGPVFLPRLRDGGAILVDDAARPDEIAAVELWRAAESGCTVTRLATEKGYAVLTVSRDGALGNSAPSA